MNTALGNSAVGNGQAGSIHLENNSGTLVSRTRVSSEARGIASRIYRVSISKLEAPFVSVVSLSRFGD